jgi:hypothetical protein
LVLFSAVFLFTEANIFSIKLLPPSRPDTAYLGPQWELVRAATDALWPTLSSRDPSKLQGEMTFGFIFRSFSVHGS